MTEGIHHVIKKAIENNPKLTQRGLAGRLGVNPAAVNRMLYGKRNIKVHEVPIIEEYLGVRLESLHGAPAGAAEAGALRDTGVVIPVYNRQDQLTEWVSSVPHALQAENTFAVYVVSDDMEPRYFQGEIVYAHKDKPPQTGRDCIIKTNDGQRRIRQFLKKENQQVVTHRFHPPQEERFQDSDIAYICAIIGRA